MTDTEKIDAITARMILWAENVTLKSSTGIAWDYAYLVDDITEIIMEEN